MKELEDRIEELEERIKTLEKTEKRRKRMRTAGILVRIFIFAFVIVALWYGYNYVNTKYIKPYKEKMDTIEEKYDSIKNLNFTSLFK